jgi:hypothetical protein
LGNYKGECEDIQPQYLHYPKFKREGAPTLREASDRPTYLSMDVQKTNTGNFQFGSVTYVVAPSPTSQFFVVPFDTGVYGWTGQRSGSDFFDIARPALGQIHF